MPVFLYAVKIIERPSPSRFALAAAGGGGEEITLRLTLGEGGEIIHEQWVRRQIGRASCRERV